MLNQRHSIKNRPIIHTHCLSSFVSLVLLVAAAKIHFKEQAEHQQSRQANKAVKPACFVLCPLLALTLQSGIFPTKGLFTRPISEANFALR
jgi:hypothetical protein